MKFQSVHMLLALALAGGTAGAQADAAYDMGILGPTPYVNTVTVAAGPSFTLPGTGGLLYNFTDAYAFSVVGAPAVAGTSVTVNLDLGSLGFHISNLKLDLFDADDAWLDGDIVSGADDASVSVGMPLAPGDYVFKVRGYADGAGTGQGIYTFTAAAVPEARTYAMLMAGLGLVGFTVLRRRAR